MSGVFVVVSMHWKDRIVLEVGAPGQEVCAYRVPWVFLCSFSLFVSWVVGRVTEGVL